MRLQVYPAGPPLPLPATSAPVETWYYHGSGSGSKEVRWLLQVPERENSLTSPSLVERYSSIGQCDATMAVASGPYPRPYPTWGELFFPGCYAIQVPDLSCSSRTGSSGPTNQLQSRELLPRATWLASSRHQELQGLPPAAKAALCQSYNQ